PCEHYSRRVFDLRSPPPAMVRWAPVTERYLATALFSCSWHESLDQPRVMRTLGWLLRCDLHLALGFISRLAVTRTPRRFSGTALRRRCSRGSRGSRRYHNCARALV